jgi:hypothetical protein
MKVVGITGLAGSGKTTLARYLVEQHGFTRTRFADCFKGMTRFHLEYIGADEGTIERMLESDLKQVPTSFFADKTPREYMQWLGTEFGRDKIHPEIWVASWESHIKRRIYEGCTAVVADDVRFPNETAAIYRLGGIIVHVSRPGLTLDQKVAAHESEKHQLESDVHIINDGDLAKLFRAADFRIANWWPAEKAA